MLSTLHFRTYILEKFPHQPVLLQKCFWAAQINTMFTSNHLGVTFSVDGKWSKHINNVAKASRQIVVLHKIIFNVSRNFRNIYITFIRPLLEYSCEVWDNCTVDDADKT